MRLAVIIKKTTFHKSFGGMEVQNKLLCEGFARRGHDVVVFSPKAELSFNEKIENNVKYVFLESNYRYFLEKLNKNSWFNDLYNAFKKVHSENKFDLVISQSSAGYGLIERKNELKIKVISIAHGSALGEFKTYCLNHSIILDFFGYLKHANYALLQYLGRQRRFILHSDKVVAVSSAVKEQLVKETSAPDNLITIIHNGIDPFEINNISPHSFKKLIYVGQLEIDKGTDMFFEFLKDIRFKDFQLDLIGGGTLLAAFQQEAVNSSNFMQLKVFGKHSNNETIDILQKEYGAIFVFPTRRVEGFPMVLVEAMFAGLPIVAYDIGGNKDAIVPDETGVLIKFGDKGSFINRLLALAADPVKMDLMSKNSLAYANKNFTLENMLNSYTNLIQEVLKI